MSIDDAMFGTSSSPFGKEPLATPENPFQCIICKYEISAVTDNKTVTLYMKY